MPGPNVGLSVGQGVRVGLWAVLGTSTGLAVHLAVVALFNPKTLLFLVSFLPQFVVVDHPFAPQTQIYLLAGLYLLILAVVDCGWVVLASWAQRFLGAGVTIGRMVRFGCLSAAALILALVKR